MGIPPPEPDAVPVLDRTAGDRAGDAEDGKPGDGYNKVDDAVEPSAAEKEMQARNAANEELLLRLSKSVEQLQDEMHRLKEKAKHKQKIFDAGKREVEMARELTDDLR